MTVAFLFFVFDNIPPKSFIFLRAASSARGAQFRADAIIFAFRLFYFRKAIEIKMNLWYDMIQLICHCVRLRGMALS